MTDGTENTGADPALTTQAGAAGWNDGAPPKDGAGYVACGRITWTDECGGGSTPFVSEIYWDEKIKMWCHCDVDQDGMTVARFESEVVHVDYWISRPDDEVTHEGAQAMELRPPLGSAWIPSEVSPPIGEDFGLFFRSDAVLFTDGKDQWVGYLQTWEEEEYQPTWKIKGPDGWDVDNVTHWMPLPSLPNAQERVVKRSS